MSSTGKQWAASTLSHISGKDKRYTAISERTLTRRTKKFAVGRQRDPPEQQGTDDDRAPTAGLGRSRSPSARLDTAASTAARNGFVEEASYDQLETGRPVRLNTPTSMDVPDRVPLPPVDVALVQQLFSPAAHRDRKRGVKHVSGMDLMAQLTDSTDDSGFKSKMADATMLATASRRAGDGPGEGLSFYRLGLLQDNITDYRHAIQAYKKYLSVCERLDDPVGGALALNCIGVNLVLMAQRENEVEKKEKYLRKASGYHQRHFDMGDNRAKFVAKINGGLVLALLGEYQEALSAYQDALKWALILKAPREQAVAFGNLSHAAFEMGAHEQAQQFLEQQLTLLEDIPLSEEEAARANLLVARVAAASEEFEAAKEACERAVDLAKQAEAAGLEKVAKCYLGANLGRSMLTDVVHETAKQIRQSLGVGGGGE